MQKFFNSIVDFVLPVRSDFEIVRKLDEKAILGLPRAARLDTKDTDSEWITPIFAYKDKRVKAMIWELKYRENILPLGTVGKIIFEEMFEIISDIVLFDSKAEFILLPIPMTSLAKAERGFNQSELICKAILECDTQRTLLYAPQWFSKVKETPKQSLTESRLDRMRNLEDSFDADPRLEGKYIFLVDDVVTTGSTLFEARKTLQKIGARDVFAFAIAH